MAPINSPGSVGKFYQMKSLAQCQQDGSRYQQPLGNAAGHMASCLTEPDSNNKVTVVTITSKDCDRGLIFIPIYPTSRQKPNNNGQYPFRLEIEGYPDPDNSPIDKESYLRLEPFPLPFEMLVPVSPKQWIDVSTYVDGEDGWAWEEERMDWWAWSEGGMKNWVELEEEVIRLSPLSLEYVLRQWTERLAPLAAKRCGWGRLTDRMVIDAEKMRLASEKREEEAKKANQQKADIQALLATWRAEKEADAFLASFDD